MASIDRYLTETGSAYYDLNFSTQTFKKSGTSFSLATLPGFSFSREGPASYIDASGILISLPANVPRITSKGIYVEEASTNYAYNFTGPGGSSWGQTQVSPQTAISVDGRKNASTSIGSGRVFAETNGLANGVFTGSIYLRANSPLTARLVMSNRASDVIQAQKTVTVTSEWQRYEITGITNGVNTGARFQVYFSAAGLELCCAQVEPMDHSTTYIPTVDRIVTRGADSPRILFDVPQKAPFTTYVEAYSTAENATNATILGVRDSSNYMIGLTSRLPYIFIGTGLASSEGVAVDQKIRITASVDTNMRINTNGSMDTVSALPTESMTFTGLDIGHSFPSTNSANMYISRIVVLNRAISNLEITRLTAPNPSPTSRVVSIA